MGNTLRGAHRRAAILLGPGRRREERWGLERKGRRRRGGRERGNRTVRAHSHYAFSATHADVVWLRSARGTDIFGLALPNPKIMADLFAERTGRDVYVPDLFDGAFATSLWRVRTGQGRKSGRYATPSPR